MTRPTVASTRGSRRAVLRAAVALLVAACSSTPPASTSPTAPPITAAPTAAAATTAPESPAASAAPTEAPPSAAATIAPTAGPTTGPSSSSVLAPGSAIEVSIAELNLRARPSTSATRIEILERGQVLVVMPYDQLWFGVGPVQRNGFTWYPVAKLQTGGDGDLPALPTRPILIGTEVEVGWVATTNGEASYVRSLPPRCPATVNLVNVQAMLSAERLACFGGGPIVLEGVYGCPVCGATLPGLMEPLWLGYQESLAFLSVDPPDEIGPLVLRFPPDGPADPPQGSIVRVTVHVDDPAAATCAGTWYPPNGTGDLVPVPATTMITYCREQLVVDAVEVLGMDADFFE